MKVWIVIGNVDYEGNDVLAVFSSKENADKYQEFREKQARGYYDSFSVNEFELDRRPE